MNLLWNWRTVAKQAWSFRLTILAALLSAAEFAMPFIAPEKPSGIFAAAAALVSIAAAAARLFSQPKTLP